MLFRSKYMDLDLANLSSDEFAKVYNKIILSIMIRSIGGIVLFIICVVLLVYGGKYAW